VPASNPISAQRAAVLTEFGMVEGQDFTLESLQTPVEMGTLYTAFTSTMAKGNNSADSPESSPESTSLAFVCSDRQYDLYWYHPNYLGSVDLVTNKAGRVHQFFMYTAWGEAMYEYTAQSSSGSFDSPYRFNGKELDKETGYGYYGARYYQSKLSMWLSVDPHAGSYPSLSPYLFVANNPINAIDPDGRDIWELNSSGEVINRIENTEMDQFVIIDNDGNRIEGNTYEYGTVKQRKGHKDDKGRDITLFEVSGDQSASEIFEFFGDNYTTNRDMATEWTHAKVGTENSERNIIGTIHEPKKTSVGHYLMQTGYTLREVNHNHPHGTDPSGLPRQSDGTPATHDIKGAEAYQDKFPNVKLNVYRSRIAYPEVGGYHPYNRKGCVPSSFDGWRTNGN
jgi:RHS repeat-associated protein